MSLLLPSRFFGLLPSPNRYSLTATLTGHTAAVNVMQFNSTVTLLATGGDDEEVRIWDWQSCKCVQILRDSMLLWGPITALKFINPECSGLSKDVMCFATGHGYFVMCDWDNHSAYYHEIHQIGVFGAGDGVESFDFDPYNRRFAMSSHHGGVKVFKLERNEIKLLWSASLPAVIPRAIKFASCGSSLWIYVLETGEIYCRDVETSNVKFTKQLRTPIGNVDVCQASANVVIDNLATGFDLYSSGNFATKTLFSVPCSQRYVKTALFGEAGKVVVGGSDHGQAYVFDVPTGQVREALHHGSAERLVQSLGVASTKDYHTIATSASNKVFDIKVWKKSVLHRRERSTTTSTPSVTITIVEYFVFAILLWLMQDYWFYPLKEHYETAVLPRLQPAVNNYMQTWQSTAPASTATTNKPEHTPNLVDLVESMDEETVRRILGPNSRFLELAQNWNAEDSRKAGKTPKGGDLVVVSY